MPIRFQGDGAWACPIPEGEVGGVRNEHGCAETGPTDLHPNALGRNALVTDATSEVLGPRAERPKLPEVSLSRSGDERLLPGEHGGEAGFIGMVPAQQVQQPMAGEEQQLRLQAGACRSRLAGGALQGDHDVAQFEGLAAGLQGNAGLTIEQGLVIEIIPLHVVSLHVVSLGVVSLGVISLGVGALTAVLVVLESAGILD